MRAVLGPIRRLFSPSRWSRWYDRWVRGRDNPWLGRLVELHGDRLVIEGCRFSLDSPTITTRAKSWFVFGSYERPEREAIRRYLDPRLPVVELGASLGVVACLTNRRLRQRERHVVVEANPELVPLLERNRVANGCEFTIVQRALHYGGDRVDFYLHPHFLGGSTHPVSTSSTVVPTTTLKELLDRFDFTGCTLICDIEGGEASLVEHEAGVLRDSVALLVLEVHPWLLGSDGVAGLLGQLAGLGFELLYSEADTYVLRNPRF